MAQKVKVVTDTRDLGAHLNAAAGRLRGATLTRRMRAAMISMKRLGRMEAPYDQTTAIIMATMIPKGLRVRVLSGQRFNVENMEIGDG